MSSSDAFYNHSQYLYLLGKLITSIELDVVDEYVGKRVKLIYTKNQVQGIISDVEFFDNGRYIIYIDLDNGNQTSTSKVLELEFL